MQLLPYIGPSRLIIFRRFVYKINMRPLTWPLYHINLVLDENDSHLPYINMYEFIIKHNSY